MNRIDLNCDMGELPEAIADGTQEVLLRSITSANVACGGHAGDEQTMRTTIEQAARAGVAIGAHPGYADRKNFGRLELDLSLEAVADLVFDQVCALAEIADRVGTKLTHVKPHGALYNQAVKNRDLAAAIARGITKALSLNRARHDPSTCGPASPRENPTHCHAERSEGYAFRLAQTGGLGDNVVLVGLAGSSMLDVFREAGFPVAGEAFADRRYESDGTLRSRKFDNALIRDPAEAARQALNIVKHGTVTANDGTDLSINAQTICIHGDTPGATQIAAAVAQTLRDCGVALRSL